MAVRIGLPIEIAVGTRDEGTCPYRACGRKGGFAARRAQAVRAEIRHRFRCTYSACRRRFSRQKPKPDVFTNLLECRPSLAVLCLEGETYDHPWSPCCFLDCFDQRFRRFSPGLQKASDLPDYY